MIIPARVTVVSVLVLLCSACGEGGAGLSAGGDAEDPALAESVEELDAQVEAAQDFINTAGARIAAELAAADAALVSGAREETRALAEALAAHYRNLSNDLQIAAGAAALALPSGSVAADALSDLAGTGDAFDTAYLRRSVIAGEELLSAFEAYGRKGEIRSLAEFASGELQSLRENRDLAAGVASRVEEAGAP